VKDTLTAGIESQSRYTVTEDMSPGHLPVKVLSTPSMVGLVEGACITAMQGHLDEGETSVGTHVCVSHEAAVMAGQEITVSCRLTTVTKRRLEFEVTVEGPAGTVSRGTHQRAVIDTRRFG